MSATTNLARTCSYAYQLELKENNILYLALKAFELNTPIALQSSFLLDIYNINVIMHISSPLFMLVRGT